MKPFSGLKTNDKENPFGARAAEKDALLMKCFIDNGLLSKIQENDHFIVTGPKGSGKSAIATFLAKTDKYHLFTREANKGKFFPLLSMLSNNKIDRAVLIQVWNIFIIMELLSLLGSDQSLFQDPKWINLEKIVKELHGKININRKESFRQISFDLIKLLPISLGSASSDSINPTALFYGLSTLVEQAIDTIASIKIKNKHLILFDHLDDDYEEANKIEFKEILTCLLIAADQINTKTQKRVKVIVFLRDDILNQLYSSNINKILDQQIPISWGNIMSQAKDNFGMLIKKRLEALSGQKIHGNSWNEFYNFMFSGTPINQKVLQWISPEKIIDRTMFRPRDIIEYMNCIYKQFEKINNITTSSERDLQMACYEAEREYSKYLLLELKDTCYIEINEYVDFHKIITCLRTMYKETFELKHWYATTGVDGITEPVALKCLKLLYAHGAIGIDDANIGERWSFRGNYDDFRQGVTYKIHPGLIKEFNLYFAK